MTPGGAAHQQAHHLLRVGDVILLFNVALFLAAMTLLGIELEIGKVKTLVRRFDSSAFVTAHPLSGVDGGMVKRSVLH